MLKEPTKNSKVTGVGSALIDLLIYENEDFLLRLGKQKGGMTLVPDLTIEEIMNKTAKKPVVMPGGAACNTIVGIGKLGGDACFIGKRGEDAYGVLYEENIKKSNVSPLFYTSSSPTGKVLSIITPDAQRSMFTCLGASTELEPDSITPDLFHDSKIVLIEGYLLFNPDLMMACLQSASKAGAMIALDLASFEVVQASKAILKDIIIKYIDILVANEDEAKAYTGFSDEIMALESLASDVQIAALKIGSRGSHVFFKGETIKIDAVTGNPPKDTTGAGDLWAAGFLYGLANGYSVEKSGEIASACGYEVCQVVGAQIPEEGWERIRKLLT